MRDEQPRATGSFIQFGDGPWVPVTNVTWDPIRFEVPAEHEPTQWRLLTYFSTGEISLPTEATTRLARAVGMPETVVDRLEVETHPDLQELNLQMDGFYNGPEGQR